MMARPELLDSERVDDGGEEDAFEFRVDVVNGDFTISNSNA